ncbi:unnamed protein product [Allacma fusca]|uniref:Uncharacterized protein n=1 Tax=Allacma fusca TaxID=39272 RepID=A0A8J2P872_9HEXA|nr:unnamed protein product [Allacma fusca]
MALNKDDLKGYPDILAFTMIDMLHITSLPDGFFQYTKDLRMINITGTRIINLNEIPSSVIDFNYSRCDFEYVKLPQLENVEKVTLRNCTKLKKVPDLPLTAPLKFLDLKGCSLVEANYSQVAAFCLLELLLIQSVDISTPNHLERCCGLIKWSKMHDFKRGYRNQKCNGSVDGCLFAYQKPEDFGKTTIFDFNIDQASKDAYADCWRAIYRRRFFIILGLILIALLLLAFVGFILYFVVKAKMKARRQQLESDFLSPSEVEAESEPEAGSIRDSETESTRGTSDKG